MKKLICIHCGSERKNLNSLTNHQRLCKNNPNRQLSYFSDPENRKKFKFTPENQYTKAKRLGLPKPEISEETRKKLSIASIITNKERWSKEENRLKHAESMKKAVEKYPDSYTSSNRGRAKQIIYDNIKFIGKWELDFYKYCKNNNIKIQRCIEWFEYEWNGKRKYFPDFYLPDLDLYIEVKGYETDRDKAKWNDFPKKLKVIKKEQIKLLRENKVLDL